MFRLLLRRLLRLPPPPMRRAHYPTIARLERLTGLAETGLTCSFCGRITWTPETVEQCYRCLRVLWASWDPLHPAGPAPRWYQTLTRETTLMVTHMGFVEYFEWELRQAHGGLPPLPPDDQC